MATRTKKAGTPENESPRAKFERVASLRVNRALKSIRLVGLASGSGFEFTAEDVSAMRQALTDAVAAVLDRFAPGSKAAPDTFSFGARPKA